MKTRYTLSEIQALPTLSVAQDANLKAEEWDTEAGTGTRVWLVRDPDRPVVQIERYNPDAQRPGLPGQATPPGGGWEITETYEPVDDRADDGGEDFADAGFASEEEQAAFEEALAGALPEAAQVAGDGLLRAQLGQVGLAMWQAGRKFSRSDS